MSEATKRLSSTNLEDVLTDNSNYFIEVIVCGSQVLTKCEQKQSFLAFFTGIKVFKTRTHHSTSSKVKLSPKQSEPGRQRSDFVNFLETDKELPRSYAFIQ